MKQHPVITIVGRQNVGKSTLYNALSGKSIAITRDEPGVTRDVLKNLISRDLFIKKFYLCDTPGLDIESINDLTTSILEISFNHLYESDIIIYLLDRNRITPYDEKLINALVKDEKLNSKHVIYCVNKSDREDDDYNLDLYYSLGLKEILPISAKGRRNINLLIEKLNFFLKSLKSGDKTEAYFKIALVGKPNAGKSSLLNALLGYERSVVSEVAGTTRDPNNSYLNYKNQTLEIFDTAGIRKKSEKADSLEYYSYTRAVKTIENVDIVVILIDATKGIGEFDKKIFALVQKSGKPAILAVNKWDLLEDKDAKSFVEYKKDMEDRFPPVKHMPVISISAVNRQRLTKLLDECIALYEHTTIKVTTSELNKKLRLWLQNSVFMHGAKKPKLLYVTQTSSIPFKLVLFVNDVDVFKSNMVNYIKNNLIKEYKLQGIGVEIDLRSQREKKGNADRK